MGLHVCSNSERSLFSFDPSLLLIVPHLCLDKTIIKMSSAVSEGFWDSEGIKNPEAVDLQQLPVCAGNRT